MHCGWQAALLAGNIADWLNEALRLGVSVRNLVPEKLDLVADLGFSF